MTKAFFIHHPTRRASWLAVVLAWLCLSATAGAGAVENTKGAAPASVQEKLNALPNDKYGELVRQGNRIFVNTPVYARRYSGNALSCANCHLDAGSRDLAAPIGSAWTMYPAYQIKGNKVNTFEERVQECFRFSMNGFAPAADSHEMRALVAYAQWLSHGLPVGVQTPGRGFLTIARTGSDPNPLRGRDIYKARCASCHNEAGEGRKKADGGYLYPPLWGFSSYNKGAGFYRVDLLAGFVKANMPLGAPNLTDQEALDVAAWINLQERWPDPRKSLVKGFFDQ